MITVHYKISTIHISTRQVKSIYFCKGL